MQLLRTPDERFASLPDFPYAPHHVEVDAPDGTGPIRVHHLDVGPASSDPVLLLHGEPSWSFLYRHMIPTLVEAGHRCIAPDLVGFGRSDKPAQTGDHTYQRHVDWMAQVVFDRLELQDVTLVCQDWGGLIGLRLVALDPRRFSRLVIANTGMPTGDQQMPDAFHAWQEFARTTETFPVGPIVNGGCTTDLAPEVVAAYDAPFPDESYKAGPRVMPSLVPTRPDDPASEANRDAWKVLQRFDRPVLTAFSDQDPVTRGGERVFQKLLPGAQGQSHTTIEGGGHFLQEDRGPQLATVVADFIHSTS